MTRWTQDDLDAYEARTVSPSGRVSRQSVPIAQRKKTLRYTAKPVMFDGIRFASQRELTRYKDLKLLQDGKAIEGLEVHPRFDLYACGALLGFIELDFSYLRLPERMMVYEDVKDPKKNSSTRTPIYRWKRKHLEAEHGIVITEVVS